MVDLPQLTCSHCGYEWVPRKGNPVECPYCKSRDWNKEKVQKDGKEKQA